MMALRMANGMTTSSGSELQAYGQPVDDGRLSQPGGGMVIVVGEVSSETVRVTHALEA